MEIRSLGGDGGVYCTLDTLEGSDCFGHWTVECAPFLPMIVSLKSQYPSLKILLRCVRQYKLNYLRDFGFEESDLVFGTTFSTGTEPFQYVLPEVNTCATLLIPPFVSLRQPYPQSYLETLDQFRETFAAGDMIYMTRSEKENYKSNARVFLNHAAVLETCRANGVRIVQIDTLRSMRDQARIVQGAKVLIVEQGSAVVNARLFAADCHVIILNTTFGGGEFADWEYSGIRKRNTLTLLESVEADFGGAFTIDTAILHDEILRARARLVPRHQDTYASQILSASHSVGCAVDAFAGRLKGANVYLAGIGKSGLVARKCVATWQSLGLPCHFLNVPDMLHGDIGVLRTNDVILYISNSGNTEELIQCTDYLNTHKPLVSQFLVSNNPTPKVTSVSGHMMIGAHKFVEADAANCAPTVSSVIFMMFLDRLGIRLAEANGTTQADFKRNHPSGDLGKR
jgi:D-arabinose 5-phosphate isomerase GutQ